MVRIKTPRKADAARIARPRVHEGAARHRGHHGGDLRALLAAQPEYATTRRLDRLRETEYRRLDDSGQVYLDFTGSSLYGESQLRRHMAILSRELLGNPHSVNPTSSHATELVESARRRVLEYFNAPVGEYVAIFTANASAALKLVAEAYPFRQDGHLLLTLDNHNSVNGIREYARRGGARVTYVPLLPPDLSVDPGALSGCLEEKGAGGPRLFAYPLQSNFTGVQHPTAWVEEARALGWHVICDCSAYVATNALDLAVTQPDFVPLSFYKMFGYPTGVGCLLARREALSELSRPWFAGGTIVAVSVGGDWHRLAPGYAGFEDGTLNFLALPAVEIGLDYLEDIGVDVIHTRVRCLTTWLLQHLRTLGHSNGEPMVRIYGPDRWERRGANIAFNFLDPQGRIVDERLVDELARRHAISLRTGCFCNPGAGEAAFDMEANVGELPAEGRHMSIDQYIDAIGLESGGAIRLSLGLVSNHEDVGRFLEFAQLFRDATPSGGVLPPRQGC
ncbi:MAG: aminotransferase class V-fold PLP-dependent enzyme [Actinomycetota bacterium]|nr:aminotransferase class V-fold PLP-dependent enzyme [Actinomycetota bacterium]